MKYRNDSNHEASLPINFPLSLREKLLLYLLSFGAIVESAVNEWTTPASVGAYHSFEYQEFVREKRASVQSTTSYLLAKKFIEARGKQGKREYQLTDKGLDFLFKKLPDLRYNGQKWDRYWRVVIYDIPEKQSSVRDHLRAELKRLGFKFMQKSVWLTPLPVEAELENFLKKEGLWGKILVMKSLLAISESKRLAKIFGYSSLLTDRNFKRS
ncbi:MAG: hypothetical protein AAB486_01470 [Patescibacteria group bacterium]